MALLGGNGFCGTDCAVLVRPLIVALAEVFDIQLHVREFGFLVVWVSRGGSLPSSDAVSNRVSLAL